MARPGLRTGVAPDTGDANPWTVSDWEQFLCQELAHPVRVRYGRSRSIPVHARGATLAGRQGFEVRMHRMFALAPAQTRADLARWLRVGRRAREACERLDRWIEATLAAQPKTPSRAPIEPVGLAHDLRALAAPLFATDFAADFADRPRPTLTWGRRRRSSSRRSLRLGSYDPEANLVRLHPVLDQAGVPAWFVSFVLMHEILHAAHPPRRGSGRRWIHHGVVFRTREAASPDHRRALEWEQKNLGRLIRSAREGTRFTPVREGRLARVKGLLLGE
jgi:hypothetical protein